jgi:hypothetical protein
MDRERPAGKHAILVKKGINLFNNGLINADN